MASYHIESPPASAVQQQYQTMSSTTERTALSAKLHDMHFSMVCVQQPKQSRMCGVGEKNNRRPIDPPPAVSVYVNGSPITTALMETMNLFCYVVLVHADTSEPAVVPSRERQMTALVGVTNTTLHRICASLDPTQRNPNAAQVQQGVCAFTDLSVRQEGYYRLQFHLFEIFNGEAFPLCKKESDRFRVYAAKGFPGMEPSTIFTDILKKSGIRVRVSKSIRVAKNITSKVASESSLAKFDPEEGVQQREIANSKAPVRSGPYDINAMRDTREQRYRGKPDFESYEHSPYQAPPPPVPILPPPNNARPSPSPLTPAYDRGFDHPRPDYGAFPGFNNHQSMSVYGERRDNHAPVYPERRHPEYNQRSRLHEPSYAQPAPYSGALPQAYSPSTTHYSSSAVTPNNPYVNAKAHRPVQTPYSPPTRASRPLDFNSGRRYSMTQANSLPPLQHIAQDAARDMHPIVSVAQDARHSSSNERNGQAFSTETIWPPPSVQQSQVWLYNGSTGYQGGNEGYRG